MPKFYAKPGRVAAEGAAFNKAFWEEEAAPIVDGVKRVVTLLCEIETAIEEAGRVLRIAQPPMHGKYDIRWWLDGGVREPTLVRWEINKRGKYEPKVVQRLQPLRKDGAYAVNHAEAQKALLVVQELFDARRKVLAVLVKAKRLTNAQAQGHLTAKGLWLENERAKLAGIKRLAVKNMAKAGYEIEPKLLDEVGLL